MSEPVRRIVGCMTGSSIDGLDAALVEITGAGYEMRARFIRGVTFPLGALSDRLRKLATEVPLPASEITSLARDFSLLHGEAVSKLLDGGPADFVVAHGQTVFHSPPFSWQLFNPYPLHIATRLPVLYDLRGADLAAGGQGAPITPISDYILYRHPTETRLIVNLGGFINVTYLAKAESHSSGTGLVRGGDVCACNQLLDRLAQKFLNLPYDEDGKVAGTGSLIEPVYTDLCDILRRQATAKRSLGSGDEVAQWVDSVEGYKPEDILATVCGTIAWTLADQHFKGVDRVILAGGGARNLTLRRMMEVRAECEVNLSDEFGIPIEYREAVGMAVIGALAADNVPTTLLKVTGASVPTVGGVWCGRNFRTD